MVDYTITVTNSGHTDATSLVVEDHLPVSQAKSIVVTIENKSRANFNEKTGIMEWKFDLKPKGNKKLNYTYKVEYDNDKPLDLSKL